jgi:hypothetical protein
MIGFHSLSLDSEKIEDNILIRAIPVTLEKEIYTL